jgi:hypothetical protein
MLLQLSLPALSSMLSLLALTGVRASEGVLLLLRATVSGLLGWLHTLDASAAADAVFGAIVVMGVLSLHRAGSICRGTGATSESGRVLLLWLLRGSCTPSITAGQHRR